MCEPAITARTGLPVAEHQQRTITSVLALRAADPGLPVILVLQGWAVSDYLRCADAYSRAGIDLRAEPVVGLGSVCRRQATTAIEVIIRALRAGHHPAARVRRQTPRPSDLRPSPGLSRFHGLVLRRPPPAPTPRMPDPAHQLRQLPPVRPDLACQGLRIARQDHFHPAAPVRRVRR